VRAFRDKLTFESAKAAKMSNARRPLAVVVSIWGPAEGRKNLVRHAASL
jgi:hypothetical protein